MMKAVAIADTLNSRRLASGTSVRLLSPHGVYPAGMRFRTTDAAIVVEAEVCALITRFHAIEPPEECYFSEVETLSAFEVKALAAVLLSRTRQSGGFELYPADDEYRTPDDTLDLGRAPVLNALISKLKQKLGSYTSEFSHLPPYKGGKQYEINKHATLSRKRLRELLTAIDVNNHLLIRGLGALIKAGMLFRHHHFLEQACMSLWVSLDASFHLFRREIAAKGTPDASAIDVSNYLDGILGYLPADHRYFADFYEERIKTMHPLSRYGVYPAASLCADEYDQLFGSLVPTYEYLITGRIPPRMGRIVAG